MNSIPFFKKLRCFHYVVGRSADRWRWLPHLWDAPWIRCLRPNCCPDRRKVRVSHRRRCRVWVGWHPVSDSDRFPDPNRIRRRKCRPWLRRPNRRNCCPPRGRSCASAWVDCRRPAFVIHYSGDWRPIRAKMDDIPSAPDAGSNWEPHSGCRWIAWRKAAGCCGCSGCCCCRCCSKSNWNPADWNCTAWVSGSSFH